MSARWRRPCRSPRSGWPWPGAAQSRSGSAPEAAWPVTKVTAWARPRWVSGAPRRRGRQGGGDAGNHMAPRRRPRAGLQLLAAAAEHEGVAALQPHDRQPLAGQGDQQLVDVVLRQGVARLALAHVDHARAPAAARSRMACGVSRSCTTTSARCSSRSALSGQKLRIARPRAHQPDHAVAGGPGLEDHQPLAGVRPVVAAAIISSSKPFGGDAGRAQERPPAPISAVCDGPQA